jgi:hypothetical protein
MHDSLRGVASAGWLADDEQQPARRRLDDRSQVQRINTDGTSDPHQNTATASDATQYSAACRYPRLQSIRCVLPGTLVCAPR